jgi:hypothetical protein
LGRLQSCFRAKAAGIFEDNPYGKNLEHLQSIVFPNEERQIQEVGGLIVRRDEIIRSKISDIEFQYKESIPYIGEEQGGGPARRGIGETEDEAHIQRVLYSRLYRLCVSERECHSAKLRSFLISLGLAQKAP